jgi:hypothetical protein
MKSPLSKVSYTPKLIISSSGILRGSMPSNITPSQTRKIALVASSIGWGSGLKAAERGPAPLLGAVLAEKVCAKKTIEISAIPGMSDATLE